MKNKEVQNIQTAQNKKKILKRNMAMKDNSKMFIIFAFHIQYAHGFMTDS